MDIIWLKDKEFSRTKTLDLTNLTVLTKGNIYYKIKLSFA